MDICAVTPVFIESLPKAALRSLHDAFDLDLSDKQRELAEVIFLGLTNGPAARKCSERELAHSALVVLAQVAHDLGGGTYYITRLSNVRMAKMRRAIHARFNGRNHAQLAREYGVTEMRVRQILSTKP